MCLSSLTVAPPGWLRLPAHSHPFIFIGRPLTGVYKKYRQFQAKIRHFRCHCCYLFVSLLLIRQI